MNTSKHIGYKKVQNDIIVELEILGNHNEDRNYIDKRYAKMRCSKAKVLNIYSIFNMNIKFQSAKSLYDHSFTYDVGQIIREKKFNKNKDMVCGEGIHYYLNKESAIGYLCDNRDDYQFGSYTGYLILADDIGFSAIRVYYENGKRKYPVSLMNLKVVYNNNNNNNISFGKGFRQFLNKNSDIIAAIIYFLIFVLIIIILFK